MDKTYRVRIYPTTTQKMVLEKHFDGYRFAYNLCLEYKSTLWRDYNKNISGFEMQKELFIIIKETNFLSNCKVECIRDAALNVHKSYQNFFKGNGFPNFKSKKGVQSFATYQNIHVFDNRIKFFKNNIKFKTSKSLSEKLQNNKIKRITFKKDLEGKYWASLLIVIKKI